MNRWMLNYQQLQPMSKEWLEWTNSAIILHVCVDKHPFSMCIIMTFEDDCKWYLTCDKLVGYRGHVSLVSYTADFLLESMQQDDLPDSCLDLGQWARFLPVPGMWWWSRQRRCWQRRKGTQWRTPHRKQPSPCWTQAGDHGSPLWNPLNASRYWNIQIYNTVT